jgi:hypothetical protein
VVALSIHIAGVGCSGIAWEDFNTGDATSKHDFIPVVTGTLI